MYTRFNIHKFFILPTELNPMFFYGSQNKVQFNIHKFFILPTELNRMFFLWISEQTAI